MTRLKITHNGRQLDDLANEALTALMLANDPPVVFVRGGTPARLRSDEEGRPIIETMRADHVTNSLADAAHWFRVGKETKTATSPPIGLAVAILARGDWRFPTLTGVVELPVLRPDGTFHLEHGYDHATKLYHWHRGAPYRAVSEHPNIDAMTAAVALIDEMLCDFPWDTSADRANAWALLLTPLIRPLVGQVPMALIDAPEPGTGKGLLVKLAALITMGRAAGLMSWPTSEEELEKKVTAVLSAGNTMVIWDNVEGMIKSGTLAAVLTAEVWQGRILGRSETATLPNRATWVATGNNIDVGGDLARRCYRIRLDAHQAQPWRRTGFKHDDLEGWTAANRGRIIHALCTVIRGWWMAGKPLADNNMAMGGYTEWLRIVGGIISFAGIGDFLANLDEFHASADVDAQAWEAFLTAWSDRIGEEVVTVGELMAKMGDVQFGSRLREALPDEISGYWATPGFSRRLGLALRKRAGRHYGEDGLHLVEMPRDRRRVAMYMVTDRTGSEPRECENNSRGDSTPADDNAVTSDDTNAAGVADDQTPPSTTKKHENKNGSREGETSRDSRTPARSLDEGIF